MLHPKSYIKVRLNKRNFERNLPNNKLAITDDSMLSGNKKNCPSLK